MRADFSFLVLTLALSPLHAANTPRRGMTPIKPSPRSTPAVSADGLRLDSTPAIHQLPLMPLGGAPGGSAVTPSPNPGLEPGADGTYPGAGIPRTPTPLIAAPKPAPKTPARAAADLNARAEALAPHLEAAAKGESPRETGEKIERELTGAVGASRSADDGALPPADRSERKLIGLAAAELEKAPASAPAVARPLVVPMTGKEFLNNPGDLYEMALARAVKAAEARGWAPKDVHFGYATANIPVRDGVHWSFTFFVAKPVAYELNGEPVFKTAKSIGVDFRRGITTLSDQFEPLRVGPMDMEDVLPAPIYPRLDGYVRKGFELSPEQALSQAQRFAPGLQGFASILARWQAEPVSGDVDMWYRFFDDLEHKVEVNARTGEARWIQKPVEPLEGAALGWGSAGGIIAFAGILMIVMSFAPRGGSLMAWGLGALVVGGAMLVAAVNADDKAQKARKEKAAAALAEASPEPQPEPPAREPADGMRDGDVFGEAYKVAGMKAPGLTRESWERLRDEREAILRGRGATDKQLAAYRRWVDEAQVWGGEFRPSPAQFEEVARLAAALRGANAPDHIWGLIKDLKRLFGESKSRDYQAAVAEAVIAELRGSVPADYRADLAEVLAGFAAKTAHLRLKQQILEAVIADTLERGGDHDRVAASLAEAAAAGDNPLFKDAVIAALGRLREKAPEGVDAAIRSVEESRKKK